MMYPRLRLAKDLLSDDGVIFISIDDNEIENLKNFVAKFLAKVILSQLLIGKDEEDDKTVNIMLLFMNISWSMQRISLFSLQVKK